jgi:hypothetical protein
MGHKRLATSAWGETAGISLHMKKEKNLVEAKIVRLAESVIAESRQPSTHGSTAAVPTTAPAWNTAPRALSGMGSIIYGAQLPGR